MKIPAIKLLAEQNSIEALELAEARLYDEQHPEIDIPGEDEGEQLTHILAALEILRDIRDNGSQFNVALRNYTQRVRNSIS